MVKKIVRFLKNYSLVVSVLTSGFLVMIATVSALDVNTSRTQVALQDIDPLNAQQIRPTNSPSHQILNPDYWLFLSDTNNSMTTSQKKLIININQPSDLTFLYQSGFVIKPNTTYLLTVKAKAATPAYTTILLTKNSDWETNLGLDEVITLNKTNAAIPIRFQTSSFSGNTNDTRLQFIFSDSSLSGKQITFENINLIETK